MNILEIVNLTVKIEDKIILSDINISLKQKESYVLFGPNGSGKTTLISAIMGIPSYQIQSGKIHFLGTDITQKSIDERAKMGMAASFQHPPEITGVKLADILKLCLGKNPKEAFSDQEANLIEAFKLKSFLNRDINVGFSGGERKRAEILQVIFLKPKLLLLDEPDSGVDVDSLKLIEDEIQNYVDQSGASILIITHKGDIMERVKANYGCILLNGKVHCFVDPMRIYKDIKRVGYEECVACRERHGKKWKD